MHNIIEAVKAGDKNAMLNHVELLKSMDNKDVLKLLKESPSEEFASFIKNITEHVADLTTKENMTEEDVLKKFTTGNAKVDKAGQLLLNGFKQNIENISFEVAGFLSFGIAELVFKNHITEFPKIVRGKAHNLKENKKLCMEIYAGKIKIEEFVRMSAVDMMNDVLRNKHAESIKDSILDSQIAKPTAETAMFKCSKCKTRKCSYYQLQTRSCDEPMTTFVTCVNCGNRWKF